MKHRKDNRFSTAPPTPSPKFLPAPQPIGPVIAIGEDGVGATAAAAVVSGGGSSATAFVAMGVGALLIAVVALTLGAVSVHWWLNTNAIPGNNIGNLRSTGIVDFSDAEEVIPAELKQIPLTQEDVTRRAESFGSTPSQKTEHLILGAGTAGSLVFHELVKKFPNDKIVLLDVGQDETRIPSANPVSDDNPQYARANILSAIQDSVLGWKTSAKAFNGGNPERRPIGDFLGATWGGTSTINAGVWLRPSKVWFDQLHRLLGGNYTYELMLNATRYVEHQNQTSLAFGTLLKDYDGSIPGRTLDTSLVGVDGRVYINAGFGGPDVAAVRDVFSNNVLPGRSAPLPVGVNWNDPAQQTECEHQGQLTLMDQSSPEFAANNPYASTSVGSTYTPPNAPGNAKGPAYASLPKALGLGDTYKQNKQRSHAASAYLYPIVDNPGLYPNAQIISRAFVTRLLYNPDDPSEVIGAEYVEDGYQVADIARSTDRSKPEYKGTLGDVDRSAFTADASEANREAASTKQVFASKYVWSCLGAKGSPKLLQLSGIGDPDKLRTVNNGPIPLHANLPGVGRKVQDTMDVNFLFTRENDMSTDLPFPFPAATTAFFWNSFTTLADPVNPLDPLGTASISGINLNDAAQVKLKSRQNREYPDFSVLLVNVGGFIGNGDYQIIAEVITGINSAVKTGAIPSANVYEEGFAVPRPVTSAKKRYHDFHIQGMLAEHFAIENDGTVCITDNNPFKHVSFSPGLVSLNNELENFVDLFENSLLPMLQKMSHTRYGFRGPATYIGQATGGAPSQINLLPILLLGREFVPTQPGLIDQSTYDTASALSGYVIHIVAGAGAGQYNVITVWSGSGGGYVANVLVPWTVEPDATSQYTLNPPGALPTDSLRYAGNNYRNAVKFVDPAMSDFTTPFADSTLNNPLTTYAGSTRITVNMTTPHLMQEGDMIRISGVTTCDTIDLDLVNDYHLIDSVPTPTQLEIVVFWNRSPVGGPGSAPVPSPATSASGIEGTGGTSVVIEKLNLDKDKLRMWIEKKYFIGWHTVSSTKMGNSTDTMAVVDETAAVYNIKGLKVVDSGIIPTKPDANIQQLVYAIAKRVVDINEPHLSQL